MFCTVSKFTISRPSQYQTLNTLQIVDLNFVGVSGELYRPTAYRLASAFDPNTCTEYFLPHLNKHKFSLGSDWHLAFNLTVEI